jgi:hypothetical protein
MAEAVDRSHRLLPADAQRLFQQLSVFAGSFDLGAIEAVSHSGEHVLGWLTVLVDNSLVLTERVPGGPMRYRLLEPVRQHAEALLASSGTDDEVRRRHVEHYLDLARRYDQWGIGAEGPPVRLEQLAREETNLLAAFNWARTQPSDLAVRLGGALARCWAYGGRVSDGLRWIEEVLANGPHDPYLEAGALAGAGLLAWRKGEYHHAQTRLEQALDLVDPHDHPVLYPQVLLWLAAVEFSVGSLEMADRTGVSGLDPLRRRRRSSR